MLYLGYKESEQTSMNILRILADNGMDYEKKNDALKKYEIQLRGGLAEEVRSMCDYGAYVEKKCMEKGLQKGVYTSLCSLMENLKIDLHEAMKLLNVPESEYDHYAEMMKS